MKRFAPLFAALVVAVPGIAMAASTPLATGPNAMTVTGEEVLAEAAQRLPADVRAQALADPNNVATLVNDIALKRILAEEAVKANLDKDPTVALQLQLMRERVLAEVRLAKLAEGSRPDRAALEKAAQGEYRSETEKFVIPEQVRARHILIDARSCEAEKRIAELLQQARAPGADFAALARENSHDPGTAKRGGDLGFFGRGRMAPEFEKAAFALTRPGEISEVVKTTFGFHIIQLEERKPAAREPFEKVRESIITDLAARELRNQRRMATEAAGKDLRLDQEAIAQFAKQPR